MPCVPFHVEKFRKYSAKPTDWPPLVVGHQREHLRVLAEQRAVQLLLGGQRRPRLALVFGQVTDERDDRRDVGGHGVADHVPHRRACPAAASRGPHRTTARRTPAPAAETAGRSPGEHPRDEELCPATSRQRYRDQGQERLGDTGGASWGSAATAARAVEAVPDPAAAGPRRRPWRRLSAATPAGGPVRRDRADAGPGRAQVGWVRGRLVAPAAPAAAASPRLAERAGAVRAGRAGDRPAGRLRDRPQQFRRQSGSSAARRHHRHPAACRSRSGPTTASRAPRPTPRRRPSRRRSATRSRWSATPRARSWP